jgi:hypothetical protein
MFNDLTGFVLFLVAQPVILCALIVLAGLMFLNIVNAIREERRDADIRSRIRANIHQNKG